MSLASDLRAAKALIDTPEKWRQGLKKSSAGYCAEEAIEVVTGGDGESARDLACMSAVRGVVGASVLFLWNDDKGTTHADVMAAFDKAIAKAEQEEKP